MDILYAVQQAAIGALMIVAMIAPVLVWLWIVEKWNFGTGPGLLLVIPFVFLAYFFGITVEMYFGI